MAASRSFPCFLSLLLLIGHTLARVCYMPNGDAAIGQTPCFPDKAQSACCNPGDFCTTRGFCFSNSVTYYSRQSCTDQTWQSDACVKDCIANKTNTYVNILTCDDTSGDKCCAYDGNCCSDPTTIDLGVVMALPFQNGDSTSSSSIASRTATSAVTSSASSSSSNSISSAAASSTSLSTTPTTSPSAAAAASDTTKDTIIGIAVGVPLGTLLFVAIGAFFFREHQHRRRRRKESAAALDKPLPIPGSFRERSIRERDSAPQYHEMPQPEMELPVGRHDAELPSRKSQMR